MSCGHVAELCAVDRQVVKLIMNLGMNG